MNKLIRVVQNDTRPQVELTLTDELSGEPMNLSDATVYLHLRRSAREGVLVSREAVVREDEASLGRAVVVWSEGDLDLPRGTYQAEVEVVATGGFRQTVFDMLDIEVRGDFDTNGSVNAGTSINTDSLAEGEQNLYHTPDRVRSALSAAGDLSYDPTTGVFSFTERTEQAIRDSFSVSGDLVYDPLSGVFSFSERTDSEVRGLFSVTGSLDYDPATGEFAFTERTDGEVRSLLSARGDLGYDPTTGEFTVTTYKSADFSTDLAASTTDDLAEGADNRYFSTAQVDAHLTGGTGVSVSAGEIAIGQPVGTSDSVTFDDLVVNGSLTVSGTTTTINTETIELADNTLLLNSNYEGADPTENSGIAVNRGELSDAVFRWNEAEDHWEVASGGALGRVLTVTDDGTHDAATLESQAGAYYLDYENFTNVPAPIPNGDGLVEFTAGTGLSGGGQISMDQFDATTIEYSVSDNSIGADQLNVPGDGVQGEFLASNGDGSFSYSTSMNPARALAMTLIFA